MFSCDAWHHTWLSHSRHAMPEKGKILLKIRKPWRCKSSKLQNRMFWINYFHLSPKGWMTSRSDKNEDCPCPLLLSPFLINMMICWIMLFLVFLVLLYQETFRYFLTFIVSRHTLGLCKLTGNRCTFCLQIK